jgi:hypothetical protein
MSRGLRGRCGVLMGLRAREPLFPESVVVESAILTRIPSTARTASAVTIRVNMGRLLLWFE